MSGSSTICPTIPVKTALGFLATPAKAFLSRSMPKRNINTMRIGITIHIVFMNIPLNRIQTAKIDILHKKPQTRQAVIHQNAIQV
jgi:hypothetical protein